MCQMGKHVAYVGILLGESRAAYREQHDAGDKENKHGGPLRRGVRTLHALATPDHMLRWGRAQACEPVHSETAGRSRRTPALRRLWPSRKPQTSTFAIASILKRGTAGLLTRLGLGARIQIPSALRAVTSAG